MTPLQIHYRKGDSCWVQGSIGVALDEERFGVSPTVDNHRGRNHVLFALTLSLSALRSRSLASLGKAGQWCPPGLCMLGSKSYTMCGREGGRSQVKALSLQSAGVILPGQNCGRCLCTVYGAMREGAEVLSAGKQPSPPGARPWLGTISPVWLGREALARAARPFLAKSVFPWYCQEVPG